MFFYTYTRARRRRRLFENNIGKYFICTAYIVRTFENIRDRNSNSFISDVICRELQFPRERIIELESELQFRMKNIQNTNSNRNVKDTKSEFREFLTKKFEKYQ